MKRLFRIPAFSIGFILTILFLLPAIPGYLIAPDNSPDANEIVPEIANRKPGFICNFIRISNTQNSNENSMLTTWLHGETPAGNLIPFQKSSLTSKGDSMRIQTLENEIRTFPVTKLVKNKSGYAFQRKYHLGTDRFGRDVLSRLILGARVSLFVGFISVVISILLGVTIGMFAGYSGGKTDSILSWLIAVFWSVPTLLIALGLSFVFGRGIGQVLIAVGLSTWVEVARVVRGQTLQLREKEFILAARISGFSTLRILFRHILPNLKGTLTVLATTNFASAILLEAGLSFLGLGISPPAPSWGIMVKEHLGNLVLDSAYLAIIPGAAIMLLVMGFNFMSMGLRDAFDTRLNSY
ncbi:MAG: ABC transporter permease [Bacteroidetes bacterium]|nr:ABC transporter permease [Bacteroidota bacterium]